MKKVSLLWPLLLFLQITVLAGLFKEGFYDFNKMDLVTVGEVVYAFDFGPNSAPLASGYTKVTDRTLFTLEKGFGWLRTDGLLAKEFISVSGDQKKDYVGSSQEGVFRIILDPGIYQLTFLFHDLISRPAIDLAINFELFLEQWFLPSLRTKVLVTDFETPGGILEIRIKASKGLWVINALVITKKAQASCRIWQNIFLG